MHKQLIYIISLIFFLFVFSSCVKDGEDTDCENYITFVYDYNLQYTDLFPQEGKKMNLYIFDRDSVLIHKIIDENEGHFPSNYSLQLPIEYGEYTLMAWSGLYEQSYRKDTLIPGVSSLRDFAIQVNGDQELHIVDKELEPLWYGSLKDSWTIKSVKTIPLMKNTKTIRIVMKNMDEDGEDINVDDFEFSVVANNGEYSFDNTPRGTAYKYLPYYTENDSETGAIAELNTLRLMADEVNTFDIIHKSTGKKMLGETINLNTYLNALRLLQYSHIPLQEYLDRENHFGILFFYKGFNPEDASFVSVELRINGWEIREQDVN